MILARFTIAYWCLLLAAFLPLVCTGIAKWGMFSVSPKAGGYDNNNPRAWLALQTGWRARANAAQANTFEALPFFFAAVIIAHTLGAYQAMLDISCIFWLALRSAYVILYLGDMDKARSGIWALALLTNVAILFLGFR